MVQECIFTMRIILLLLYKGTPDILQNPIGNFVGVFQVPETVSRLRLRFESAEIVVLILLMDIDSLLVLITLEAEC